MAINEEKGPAIVIAGNGMCTAGRIKHHLKHNLWREGASLVIVGFQAAGTTGRKLAEGSSQVRIFGEDISVRARVYTIGGFSAHADQKDLLDWVGSISTSPHIFLVHGERAASDILAEKIRSQLGFNVSVPRFRERLTLKPRETVPEGALPVTEGVDVMTQAHNRLVDLEKSLKELKKRVDSRELEMRLGEEELDRLEGVQAELDALLRL
jgi:metallo-beta-lactamase family protein